MAQVAITINKKTYRMGCPDGQEARIRELGAHFGAHVDRLRTNFQRVQDDHLYLMAALVIADEYFDAREELQAILLQLSKLSGRDAAPDGEQGAKIDKDIARISGAAATRLADLRNAAKAPKTSSAKAAADKS